MKRILFILILSSFVLGVHAQEKRSHPQRTPADIARKQTEMLVRELNITDSVQRDTLYRMHLKYANMRSQHCTRADNLNLMMAIQEELKNILSPEQFEALYEPPAQSPATLASIPMQLDCSTPAPWCTTPTFRRPQYATNATKQPTIRPPIISSG